PRSSRPTWPCTDASGTDDSSSGEDLAIQERTTKMSDSTDAGAAPKKDHGVLYIGMDLGTSRTSVSSSNGVRETVYSVVGYPKDVVARKLLQRDVLFGKEAIEKRLSLKVYKPLEKG